jgi:hypothetical protein
MSTTYTKNSYPNFAPLSILLAFSINVMFKLSTTMIFEVCMEWSFALIFYIFYRIP